MVQRTVLKVHISCGKCKKKLLKAVSGLEGVDKIEVDAAKETLTVTGNVDPYEVILRARKAGKYAEVLSIGPPPPPSKPVDAPKKPVEKKKPDEKKPDEKKPEPKVYFQDPYRPPYPYPMYDRMAVVPVARYYEEPNPSCSIM